jgi:hypothetical protein
VLAEASIPLRNTPMSTRTRIRFISAVALFALAAGVWTVEGQEPKTRSRAEFMRLKLEYSKKALEGLTLEDYDAVAKNAKALRLLSQAAQWEVPTIPSVPDYVIYTSEFQRITDDMAAKAKEKNIDGATLAYLRLTMNCVNCHKYIRMPRK